MRTVKEFAEIPRTVKPNIFNMLLKNLALGPGFDSKDDLIPEHRTYLKKLEAEYKNDTSVNWRRHIAALTKMTDTQFINYENLIDSNEVDIYVHACLAKPGKNYYLIQESLPIKQTSSSGSSSYRSEYDIERIIN